MSRECYNIYMIKNVNSEDDMVKFGYELAKSLEWPFCIELIGDIGAGKTTMTKGIAKYFGGEDVSSPSFTINNRYELNDERILSHYDFYRLNEAGVVSQELIEDLHDNKVSVIVEWAESVDNVLPTDRIKVVVKHTENGREINVEGL